LVCVGAGATKWESKAECQGASVAATCGDPMVGFKVGSDFVGDDVGYIFEPHANSGSHSACLCSSDGSTTNCAADAGFTRKGTDNDQSDPCSTADYEIYCDAAARITLQMVTRAEDYLVNFEGSRCNGGKDDSFWLGWDNEGLYHQSTEVHSLAKYKDGVCTPVWGDLMRATKYLAKGAHTLHIVERENGSQLKSLKLISGGDHCRFGSQKYTTQAPTTTVDPLIALRAQLEQQKKDLAAATSATVDKDAMAGYVKAQIDVLRATLEKDFAAKLAAAEQGRKDLEANLARSTAAIEASVTALKAKMLFKGDAGDAVMVAEPRTCAKKAGDCVPEVTASEGGTLTVSAPADDVVVETKDCGSISVCELRKAVAELKGFVVALGDA